MTEVDDRPSLLRAVRKGRSAVLFRARWCPFCRAFEPIFRRVAGRDGHALVGAMLDDEANPLWIEYQVEVVPTVLFFEDGRQVERLDGESGVGLAAADLEAALDRIARSC
jgi:thioredoxin 1